MKRNSAFDIVVMPRRIFYRHTGSIAVQAIVFNEQEKLNNEAAGQTLPTNGSQSITLVLLPCMNGCWLGSGDCFKEPLKLPR